MSSGLTKNYASYKIYKNHYYKIKLSFLIILILLGFFLIVSSSFLSGEKWKNGDEIYFVVAEKNISNSKVNESVKMIEEMGGAGIVSSINNYKNCIIIFAYLNKNDANKIIDDNKKLLQNIECISVKFPSINKKLQTNQLYEVKKCLNFLQKTRIIATQTVLDYESNIIDFNEVYKSAYKLKFEINKINQSLNKDNGLELIGLSLTKLETLLDEFMKENLKGEYSMLLYKKWVVGLSLEELNIRSNFK